MMLLLNWRVWAALIVAVALAASHWKAYVIGKNTERVAVLEATQAAIVLARAEEQANAKRIQNAQSNQIKSLAVKAADAGLAASERDSLRDQVRSFTEGGTSQAACHQRAVTLGELFTACTGRYEDLAGKAQGHVVDLKALLEAWPK